MIDHGLAAVLAMLEPRQRSPSTLHAYVAEGGVINNEPWICACIQSLLLLVLWVLCLSLLLGGADSSSSSSSSISSISSISSSSSSGSSLESLKNLASVEMIITRVQPGPSHYLHKEKMLGRLYSTCASPVVPHLSTRHAHGCLASEIGRDPAFPTRYDRTEDSSRVTSPDSDTAATRPRSKWWWWWWWWSQQPSNNNICCRRLWGQDKANTDPTTKA